MNGRESNVCVFWWKLPSFDKRVGGPVNAIYANANGVKTVPIKARDDAQTGRLG